MITPIQQLENNLYIKREDFIPFSFGGNKARKAELFFKDVDAGGYDCVVTYGSSSSNHCRIVANQCAARGIKCFIISPEESSGATFNSQMMAMFGANISVVPVSDVHDTIENLLVELKEDGRSPYFIPGGGHGNIGTQAYVNCYEEIKEYERLNRIFFDYVFLASGTGTTQAGLICGQIINNDDRKIVGISIARKCPRGRDIVLDSVKEYLGNAAKDAEANTFFIDEYADGYGKTSVEINNTIDECMKKYGIPLDPTYTGKAYYGMLDYIEKNSISDKNILFIHTGGTPLFFDYLMHLARKIKVERLG